MTSIANPLTREGIKVRNERSRAKSHYDRGFREALTVYLKRDSLAVHLAMLDGIRLTEVRSTVGDPEDANNWREYLGRADDLLAAISGEME